MGDNSISDLYLEIGKVQGTLASIQASLAVLNAVPTTVSTVHQKVLHNEQEIEEVKQALRNQEGKLEEVKKQVLIFLGFIGAISSIPLVQTVLNILSR